MSTKPGELTGIVIPPFIIAAFMAALIVGVHDCNNSAERNIHKRIRPACIIQQGSLKTAADSIAFVTTIPRKFDNREYTHSCVQIIAHEGENTWVF